MTDEGAILRLRPLILKAEEDRRRQQVKQQPAVDLAFLRGATYAISISAVVWVAIILAILKAGHGLTLSDVRVGAGIVFAALALICLLAARDILRRTE